MILLTIFSLLLTGCVIVPPGYGDRSYYPRYERPRIIMMLPPVVVVRPYW